jgi:hypothetical protein
VGGAGGGSPAGASDQLGGPGGVAGRGECLAALADQHLGPRLLHQGLGQAAGAALVAEAAHHVHQHVGGQLGIADRGRGGREQAAVAGRERPSGECVHAGAYVRAEPHRCRQAEDGQQAYVVHALVDVGGHRGHPLARRRIGRRPVAADRHQDRAVGGHRHDQVDDRGGQDQRLGRRHLAEAEAAQQGRALQGAQPVGRPEDRPQQLQ